MRKSVAVLLLIASFVASANAFPFFHRNKKKQFTKKDLLITCTASGCVPSGNRANAAISINMIGSGTSVMQIMWYVSGAVSTCNFTVDGAPDNLVWTSGSYVGASSCTANGYANIAIGANGFPNYAQLILNTPITGSGSVTFQIVTQVPGQTLASNTSAVTTTLANINGTPYVNTVSCPAANDTCILNVALSGETIRVANGTYIPSTSAGVTLNNFQNIVMKCDGGAKFRPPLAGGSTNIFNLIGGLGNVTFEDCDIGGNSSTIGTVAISNGGTSVTGTGTAFTSNMVGGFIQIFGGVDGVTTHGQGLCIVSVASATSLTIGNTGACTAASPATYTGTTVSGAQYRTGWGTQQAINVNDQTCTIATISGSGTTITVTSNTCNLSSGQHVVIGGTGTFGSGATANSYNTLDSGPINVTSGCTGSACTFTFTSNVGALGSGTSGTVYTGPTHLYLYRNNIHDATLQCLSVNSSSGDPGDATNTIVAGMNWIHDCGTTALALSRIKSPLLFFNNIDHPASFGRGAGSCISSNQVSNSHILGNRCYHYMNLAEGVSVVFNQGGILSSNTITELPAKSSASQSANIHLDTSSEIVVNGNFIGQSEGQWGAAAGVAGTGGIVSAAITGGICIRNEVGDTNDIIGNIAQGCGSFGILNNSRIENTGTPSNTNTASCIVAGCTTARGHQIIYAGDQATHSYTYTANDGGGAVATITQSVPTLPSGAACTSATTPACITDAGNTVDGASTQKLCANTSCTSAAFSAGVIVYWQLDCTSATGKCIGANPSATNFLTTPQFYTQLRAASALIRGGDYSIAIGSLPGMAGCNAAEWTQKLPNIAADSNFHNIGWHPSNWQKWSDAPGMRTICLIANASNQANTGIWVGDTAIDVFGGDAVTNITGNHITRTQSSGIVNSGGANNANITGNTIKDICWQNLCGASDVYGIVTTNDQTSSAFSWPKGPPTIGGRIANNVISQTSGVSLGGNGTICIGLITSASGTIDQVQVDNAQAQCPTPWTTIFQINAAGGAITNTGTRAFQNLLESATAPTISSGFGTTPSIVTPNGTETFRVNVGTGGVATSGVIGLPTAANGWNCQVTDTTNNNVTRETAFTTTTVTVTAAAAWVASDILIFNCAAF